MRHTIITLIAAALFALPLYAQETERDDVRQAYNLARQTGTVEAWDIFLNNYPDSPLREEAMFYILASGYEYGINSQEDKMRDRLQQVVNDFDRFATSFKESKHLAEAQQLYTKTRAALAALEK